MRHENVPTRRPRATPCRMRRTPARTAAADTPNGRLAHAWRHAAGTQSPCGTPFYCTVETCSSDRNATKPTSWHNTAMRQEKIFMHYPWIGLTHSVSRSRETHETCPKTETGDPGSIRNAPALRQPRHTPCGMTTAARNRPAVPLAATPEPRPKPVPAAIPACPAARTGRKAAFPSPTPCGNDMLRAGIHAPPPCRNRVSSVGCVPPRRQVWQRGTRKHFHPLRPFPA